MKAKKVVLDLLLAARGGPLPAQQLVMASELFGFSENNIRVTLARLSADDLLESAGRGQYRLTAKAMNVGDEVNAWRNAEKRLRDWSGDYLMVFTGMLGRVDRAALKQRERTLELMGFRELDTSLHVRPNNIEKNIAAVRKKLESMGLESNALVFAADHFSAADQRRIKALWDGKALNQNYQRQSQRLNDWMARYKELELDVAARESFLLGSEAVREIVFDPLLPEYFVDVAARQAFFRSMMALDLIGQSLWRELSARHAFGDLGVGVDKA